MIILAQMAWGVTNDRFGMTAFTCSLGGRGDAPGTNAFAQKTGPVAGDPSCAFG